MSRARASDVRRNGFGLPFSLPFFTALHRDLYAANLHNCKLFVFLLGGLRAIHVKCSPGKAFQEGRRQCARRYRQRSLAGMRLFEAVKLMKTPMKRPARALHYSLVKATSNVKVLNFSLRNCVHTPKTSSEQQAARCD